MNGFSLLDRLMYDGPHEPSGSAASRSRVVQQWCDTVRRDLENLLNARWRCQPWPKGLKELDRSLVQYGIPDFTGMSVSNPVDQRTFCKIIQKTIQNFEPRLSGVTVSTQESEHEEDRTLRFQIEAMLPIDDTAEPVIFETYVDPTTSSVKVGHGHR